MPDTDAGRSDELIARALDRTAGAPLVAGNAVRLLRDAGENYPAWLEAIRPAIGSVGRASRGTTLAISGRSNDSGG